MAQNNDRLCVTVSGPVARITITNPGRRNAFDLAMWQVLPKLIAGLDADAAIRAIILTSPPGQAFCSGADISEFATLRSTAAGAKLYEAANAAAFDALAAGYNPHKDPNRLREVNPPQHCSGCHY